MSRDLDLRTVYQRLRAEYGGQEWWPAETPFEVMVGAILTQNTAWTNVERAIANLRQARALDPEAIVRASPERLAEWIRPSGYFNVKAQRLKGLCDWYLEQGGHGALRRWPTAALRSALLAVKGVGPETADDIVLYAFDRPVFVVDTYTRRIFERLGLLEAGLGYDAVQRRFHDELGEDGEAVALFNEYHALIVEHGKHRCRKRPLCEGCGLQGDCPSAGTL